MRAAQLSASSPPNSSGPGIPWLSTETYLDYRLAMPSTPSVTDLDALRKEIADSLSYLSPEELSWHAHIVVGVGHRRTAGT